MAIPARVLELLVRAKNLVKLQLIPAAKIPMGYQNKVKPGCTTTREVPSVLVHRTNSEEINGEEAINSREDTPNAAVIKAV